MIKTVVFDMDGVLINLNKEIFKDSGVDENQCDYYSIIRCEDIPLDKSREVISRYYDSHYFEIAPFYEGADRIPKELGDKCLLYVNSLSYTESIQGVKYDRLVAKGFNPKSLVLQVGRKKNEIPDTFIVVEDSPFELEKSLAKHKILIRKHYNEVKKNLGYDSDFIIVESLNEAIDLVHKILEESNEN